MNNEVQQLWREIQTDLNTTAVMWELAIIALALLIAWIINGTQRKYVLQQTTDQYKLATGSINRALFPLTCLSITLIGQFLLSGWQHTSLLQLSSRLFLAMAVVRLMVYLLRYLFSPSGWLKTLESVIVWIIWGVLALHLTGVLPEIIQSLEDMRFSIGKNHVNVLLVLQALLTVIVAIFIALWLSRVLENKLMQANQLNVNLRVVIGKLIRIILLFIATLVALSAVGLDITLLSVFGGALGVGLGFGLQRIASNYVSGFIILLDKSMQIGDMITVDKHYGVIHEMRSRYMVLGKFDGTNVIIPNETLITSAVVNHSLTEHKGRVQVQACIAFDSPLEKAMQLMREIANKQVRVLQTPAPVVLVRGFVEHGVELALQVWVEDPEKLAAPLQSALYLEIWKAFEANQIKLAKPEAKVDG